MLNERSEYFAKTLEKGIRLLKLFNENKPSWSLSEIAEQMNLNLTSVYRLANTFVELGYLQRGKQTKRLRLGPMAVTLGHQLLRGFDANRLIQPLVDGIHGHYNISIDVSLFHAGRLVQVYKRETDNTLTYRQDTVSDLLYCTGSGKSVLAFLPAKELERLVKTQSFARRSPNTITKIDELFIELKRVRQKGYALNNEEYIKGLIAVAAPILSKTTGQPLGALSFTSTTLDHKLSEFESKYAEILCDLARQLSEIIPDV